MSIALRALRLQSRAVARLARPAVATARPWLPPQTSPAPLALPPFARQTRLASSGPEEPEPAVKFFNDGVKAMEENNLEEAAIGFQKSIDHQATAVAMFNLSVCYTMMERKTEAIRILEKMHEVHGATYDSLFNMGALLVGEERLEEGVKTLKQAREMNENDFMVHFNLALAHDKLGQLEEAIKSYRRARQLNPKVPNELLQNAELKLREKKATEGKDAA